ncbi:hypothetical protein K0M31_012850 [Melipona bicolor]|uniref:DUF5641 domain-containing protein n=1 Tax=Melipona bicolor TaxID=60889 RepID=A0AA40FJQ3_9HYME|nr:hypothetical protein K0M31_012850 [Melipona bicolor]
MVVPKSERLPPLRWKLSRTAAPHLGKDGIARVLSVGAPDGLVKRPTAGGCILPVDEGGGHCTLVFSFEREAFKVGGMFGRGACYNIHGLGAGTYRENLLVFKYP